MKISESANLNLRKVILEAQKIKGLPAHRPQMPWQVDLLLVSPQKMKSLNSKYRKKRSVTDVLSFPSPKLFWKKGWLGTLAICTQVARKQAREQGHSLIDEIMVLQVHGILHLLGFDHEKSRSAAIKMAKFEKKMAKQLFKSTKSANPSLIPLIQRQSR